MWSFTTFDGAITGGEVLVEDVSEGVGSALGGAAVVLGAVGGGVGFGQRGECGEQLLAGDRIEITLQHQPTVQSLGGEEFVAVGVLGGWFLGAEAVFESGDRCSDAAGACVGPGRSLDQGGAGHIATLFRQVFRWGFGEGEDQRGVIDGHDTGVHGVGDVGKRRHAAGEGDDLGGFGR